MHSFLHCQCTYLGLVLHFFDTQVSTFRVGHNPANTAVFTREEGVLCGYEDGEVAKFDLRKTRYLFSLCMDGGC